MGKSVRIGAGLNATVVDVATDSTTVSAGPARLWKIYVNTALSANALPIQNASTAIFTLPASLAAGQMLDFGGVLFPSSLVVDPNDAATGNITVVWSAP